MVDNSSSHLDSVDTTELPIKRRKVNNFNIDMELIESDGRSLLIMLILA